MIYCERLRGGSLTLLVLAAAALLVTGCVTVNSTKVTHSGNGDVHVGDTKEGGTDVNTDLEVGVNP